MDCISTIRAAAIAMITLLFFACTTTGSPVEQVDNTVFLESRPRSILVMPPVNLSPEVKAPLTFLAASTYPLAESGYYVIPVALSDQTFKQNGITVAEEAHAIEYGRLFEIFGADAALYTTITRFGVSYYVIDSVVEAAASARLVDLRSGLELWHGQVSIAEGGNSSGGDLFSALIGAAINQIANTLSDKAHAVGRQAAYQLLSAGKKNSILYGPYHPKYANRSIK